MALRPSLSVKFAFYSFSFIIPYLSRLLPQVFLPNQLSLQLFYNEDGYNPY